MPMKRQILTAIHLQATKRPEAFKLPDVVQTKNQAFL
jgi:hypothetical protein